MCVLAVSVGWVDAQGLRLHDYEMSCGELGDCHKESSSFCFTISGFLRRERFHPLVKPPVSRLASFLVVEGITVPCFTFLTEFVLAWEGAEPAVY